MTALGLVSLASGMVAIAVGAWPVFGFLGLDVLALWIAFRISYRRADMAERLKLAGDALTVERIRRHRPVQRWTFQPFWLRVRIEEPPAGGARLLLASHGRQLEVGAFLPPDERVRVADLISRALGAYRRGSHA